MRWKNETGSLYELRSNFEDFLAAIVTAGQTGVVPLDRLATFRADISECAGKSIMGASGVASGFRGTFLWNRHIASNLLNYLTINIFPIIRKA